MDKWTKVTETDVSEWAQVMPGRADVSRRATVGGSFGKADARIGLGSGQMNMDQGIWDKNGGITI